MKIIINSLCTILNLFLIIQLFNYLSFPSFAQEKRLPIIDMHLHADLPPHEVHGGDPPFCRPEPCEDVGHATANDDETLRKTLEIMDYYNIVKAHLSGLNPEVIAKWIEAAPDRFIAAPFIFEPGNPDAEDLRQKYEEGFYTGMGEIATQLNESLQTILSLNHTLLLPRNLIYQHSFIQKELVHIFRVLDLLKAVLSCLKMC